MDPAAPPPEQVRGTQVGGREISVFLSFEHPEQSPSKGVKNTEQNASLIKRKDGSVRLNYSTTTDIKYVSYDDRQHLEPVPTDPEMFGFTRSQWENFWLAIIRCEPPWRTIRAAELPDL